MKLALMLLFAALTAQAQLAVTVSPVKASGQKAIVPLVLKNNLDEKVESARAVVFLLDEQGKMVGQSTRWVIGGAKEKPGLAAGATNAFHSSSRVPLHRNSRPSSSPRRFSSIAWSWKAASWRT